MTDTTTDAPPKRKLLFKRTITRRKTPDPSSDSAKSKNDDDGIDMFRRTEKFDEVLEEQRRRAMEKEQRNSAAATSKADPFGQDVKRRKLSIDVTDDDVVKREPTPARRSVSTRHVSLSGQLETATNCESNRRSVSGSNSKSPGSKKRSLFKDEELTDDDLIMDVKGKGKEIPRPSDTPKSSRILRSSQQDTSLDDDDSPVLSHRSPRLLRRTKPTPIKDEDGDSLYETPPSRQQPKKEVDSDDDDLILADGPKEDEPPDEFEEYVKRAREKAEREAKAQEEAAKAAAVKQENPGVKTEDADWLGPVGASHSQTPDLSDPVVEILISSDLPNTKPTRVYRKFRSSLGIVRKTFIWKNSKLLDPIQDSIFLTWKRNRIYSTTTCASLGLELDAGGVIVESRYAGGESNGFNHGILHLEAWTEELYAEYRRLKEQYHLRLLGLLDDDEDEDEDARPRRQGSEAVVGGDGGEGGGTLRVILKARDQEPLKFKVHPHTTAGEMIAVYARQREVPQGSEVSLYFDGEKQSPDSAVADMDIEDMDSLEVHFK